MKCEQLTYTENKGWSNNNSSLKNEATIVFVFGSKTLLKNIENINYIQAQYPNAILVGCSTAGEIYDHKVSDNTIIATAIYFEKSKIKTSYIILDKVQDSYEAGVQLVNSLDEKDLVHALVLSDGIHINGSQLVNGITDKLPSKVSATGGLAADSDKFEETIIIYENKILHNAVLIVGFYSQNLIVGYGSIGGWDPFGPERIITKSKGNHLYELDGKSALDLYKQYLGSHAKDLPSAALLFPLSVRDKESDPESSVVRTILSINQEEKFMTFAGDMPEGAYARLMKTNFNRLIDGASDAAQISQSTLKGSNPDFALCISCVGRKLVLKQRTDEEIEAVNDILGKNISVAGFYSYGEICPFKKFEKCKLHNQTMTITTFKEV